MSHTTVVLYERYSPCATVCCWVCFSFSLTRTLLVILPLNLTNVFQLWTLSISKHFFFYGLSWYIVLLYGIPIYDNLFVLWLLTIVPFLYMGANRIHFSLFCFLFCHLDMRTEPKSKEKHKAFVIKNVFSYKSQFYYYLLKSTSFLYLFRYRGDDFARSHTNL